MRVVPRRAMPRSRDCPNSMQAADYQTPGHEAFDGPRRNPSVAIRVDSGSHIGGAQLLRCLTLADELRRRGASVRFLSREHPGHLLATLDGCGYTVDRLPTPRSRGSARAERSAWLGVTQQE